jgi:hypothetical protein
VPENKVVKLHINILRDRAAGNPVIPVATVQGCVDDA